MIVYDKQNIEDCGRPEFLSVLRRPTSKAREKRPGDEVENTRHTHQAHGINLQAAAGMHRKLNVVAHA